MALGSSAPEILLSVIEITTGGFFSGELGPSTIVGSAAFNLLIIIAVCIVAVTPDVRPNGSKVDQLEVYYCTAFFSVFAYVWLVIILMASSPNVVEVWEALVTFLCFPLLVTMAWAFDNGLIKIPGVPKSKSHITMIGTSHFHPYEIEQFLRELDEEHKDLDPKKREEMMVTALKSRSKPSRAQYRMMATRQLTGSKKVALQNPNDAAVELVDIVVKEDSEGNARNVVNFKSGAYSVLESAGKVTVHVVRSVANEKMEVDFATEGVTANAGEDYEETIGMITFEKGEFEKEIDIKIIDDEEPEEDEMFIVKLSNPRPSGELGSEAITIVTIIDDDDPGLIGFKDEETHVTVEESSGEASIFVSRFKGSSGTITVDFSTSDISAKGGAEDGEGKIDYITTEGTLTFEPAEMRHEIKIPVKDTHSYDKADTFKVTLSNVKGPNEKAQMAEFVNCVVTVVHDSGTKDTINRVAQILNQNADKYSVGTSSYCDQFSEALAVNGGDGVEDFEGDGEPPSMSDYVMHIVTLPWKLLFALIPPTEWAGGWVCFCIALIFIGFVTAIIGDLASLFGCVIGLQDQVTAITFVALGTSLPDTFASKTAAINDDSADASIGNVTGSNSVNVFLGLGMPWLIAAIYWDVNGANDDWHKKYGGDDNKYSQDDDEFVHNIYKDYNDGAFVVMAGSLGFSVTVFVICACTALGIIQYRRAAYGCELGGPVGPAQLHASVFIFLWFLYVLLSSLQAYGHIKI